MPVQNSFFLGTGGREGAADLAGASRPLTFGEVFNLSPALIDPLNLVY